MGAAWLSEQNRYHQATSTTWAPSTSTSAWFASVHQLHHQRIGNRSIALRNEKSGDESQADDQSSGIGKWNEGVASGARHQVRICLRRAFRICLHSTARHALRTSSHRPLTLRTHRQHGAVINLGATAAPRLPRARLKQIMLRSNWRLALSVCAHLVGTAHW